jgi:G3E family GTPase
MQSTDRYVGDTVMRQLRSADLLIVNKTDLVEPDDMESLHSWFDDTVPGMPRLTTRGGRVDASILLGPLRSSEVSVVAAAPHDEFDTWSFRSDSPLRRSDIEAFLTALPPGVVRVKGILRLADDPANDYLLQRVGKRTSLMPLTGTDSGTPNGTRLVVIGVPGSIDGELFDARLSVR